MEIGNTIICDVICSSANTGVRHDGNTATRFNSGWGITVSTTRAGSSIETVRGTKLVTHFMGNVIDIIRITHRVGGSCNSPRFLTATNRGYLSNSSAARAECMTNIVVGVPDTSGYDGL